ncbi:MAG: sigma-70 family RNA polymerase sigma factor [Candidatus Solibacter usitatus]|nr:sigma-70 family RNA polymerase sigma factor [Candidatus Solibacter usitatus]
MVIDYSRKKKLRSPGVAVAYYSNRVTSVDDLAVNPAQQDQGAFADMVRDHQSMVFSMAYHFLRNRSLAEELAQDVFMELHRNLAAIQSAAHLVFWLRKVTGRRCIDQTRRRSFRPMLKLDDVPEPAAVTATRDPMLSRALGKLVASLPETPRMIVILRYQEDLEPAEIAELLEMPVSTVKSHLQRSLAMLRDKLARSVGEIAL